MKKTINFINKAYSHLKDMYEKLKTRYQIVSLYHTVKNGLFYGYFKVQIPL